MEELLKISATEIQKRKPAEKKTPVVASSVGGIPFADFEKQLRALGYTKSVKSLWDALIKNHKEFFVISHKDSVCFYQINPIYFEQALLVVHGYKKKFDAIVKKSRSADKRPI